MRLPLNDDKNVLSGSYKINSMLKNYANDKLMNKPIQKRFLKKQETYPLGMNDDILNKHSKSKIKKEKNIKPDKNFYYLFFLFTNQLKLI